MSVWIPVVTRLSSLNQVNQQGNYEDNQNDYHNNLWHVISLYLYWRQSFFCLRMSLCV